MDILSQFNYLDIIFSLIIAISILLGLAKGFISSILSLAGWILSIYLSYICFPYVRPYLEERFNSPSTVIILGSVSLMLFFIIVTAIIKIFLNLMLRPIRLGAIDRILGFAFGFLRGYLITALIYITLLISSNVYFGNSGELDKDNLPADVKEMQIFSFLRYEYLIPYLPKAFGKDMDTLFTSVLNQDAKQRFISSMRSRLEKNIPPEKLSELRAKELKDSTIYSNEVVEKKFMKALIKTYKERSSKARQIEEISEEDMKRLHKLLN